ncbi:MAG: hypothetical protein K2H85_03200, partial [Allobaculum sp.]|nr:hypothetical protein [Allobaculum sp.]
NTFYCDFDGTKVFGIETNGKNWFHLPDVANALGVKEIGTELFLEIPLKSEFGKGSSKLFTDEYGIYRLSFESDSSIARKIRLFYFEAAKNDDVVWIEDLFPRVRTA